jgi:hypothetical protein
MARQVHIGEQSSFVSPYSTSDGVARSIKGPVLLLLLPIFYVPFDPINTPSGSEERLEVDNVGVYIPIELFDPVQLRHPAGFRSSVGDALIIQCPGGLAFPVFASAHTRSNTQYFGSSGCNLRIGVILGRYAATTTTQHYTKVLFLSAPTNQAYEATDLPSLTLPSE